MYQHGTAAKNAFESFAQSESNANLLHFGNQLFDNIFKFKEVTDHDREELAKTLAEVSLNSDFNNFILDLFQPSLTTFDLKNFLASTTSHPQIAYTTALGLIQDAFRVSQSETVKRFLIYLVTSVEDVYSRSDDAYKVASLTNYTAFPHVVNEQLKLSINEQLESNSLKIPSNGLTLLALVCQRDDSTSMEPFKAKYMNIELDYSKCSKFEDVYKQAIKSGSKSSKVLGFVVDGSFKSSVQVLARVAPVWDTMSASTILRDKRLPASFTSSLSGGSQYSDSDVVNIYTGKYNLVSSSEPLLDANVNSSEYIDQITNHSAFSQLANNQKLQVAHFLKANRKRFNDILENATKVVINKIRNSVISRSWEQNVRGQSFIPLSFKSIDYNSNTKVVNDISSFMDKLGSRLNRQQLNTFSDAISFIAHEYIPMVSQFHFRCADKYGLESSRHIMSRLNSSDMEILSVGSELPQENNVQVIYQQSPSISGGARKQTVQEPIQSHRYNSEILTSGGEAENLSKVPKGSTFGMSDSSSTSTNRLVAAFVNGQREFNRSYETIYRRLAHELANINTSHFEKSQYHDLYVACSQFDGIAIKSPKTTVFISGFYGAKDYNKLYTQVVENSIQTLRRLNISGFESSIKVLEDLRRLLVDTRATMIKIRNQYIVAPKTTSEAFLVAVKDIKQECNLTTSDFTALSDAIARLFAVTKSVTGTNNSSLQQQLKRYIDDLLSRETIIRNHYEENITAIRHKFVSDVMSTENNIARDILIGFEEQKRDSMLWLNKNLDQKLTQSRLDHLKDIILTPEQLSTIESAYTTFKNTQLSKDFQTELRKIGKLIHDANNGSVSTVYKLISKLKNIIKATQYMNFLAQLYEEFKILQGINWKELEEHVSNLIIVSSIDVSEVLEISGGSVNGSYTYHEMVFTNAQAFEEFCQSKIAVASGTQSMLPINSGASFIRFLLQGCIHDFSRIYTWNPGSSAIADSAGAIGDKANFVNRILNVPDAETISFNGSPSEVAKSAIQKLSSYQTRNWFAFVNNHIYPKFDVSGDNNAADDNTDGAIHTFRDILVQVVNSISPLHNFMNGAPKVDELNIMSIAIKALNLIGETYYVDSFTGIRPYFAEHPALYVYALIASAITGEHKYVLPNSLRKPGSMNYRYCLRQYVGTNNEIQLANATFDALNANILGIIDKYWSLRYNGNLNLPTNLSSLLGGDIQNGGTIFDSAPMNVVSTASVIPEAVPFYVCAFNVCVYYLTTFNKATKTQPGDNVNKYDLYIKVSKISMLYPIYKIFVKDEATLNSLTDAQMRTIIGVLNNIWEQAEGGNSAQKLSRSIDILFNELNGCLLFSSKIQLEIIKNRGKVSNSVIDVLKRDIGGLINTVKDTIVKSFQDRSNVQGDEFATFEHLLNDAMKRVRDEPDNRRIKTLQSVICNEASVDTKFSDYYKFMELVVTPLLISAESYGKILKLFDTYSYSISGVPSTDRVNLSLIKIAYRDIINDPNLGASQAELANPIDVTSMKIESVWEIVQKISRQRQYHLKSILMENPAVLEWNRVLLNNAFHDFHSTGRFTIPRFWIVMDENTYPNNEQIENRATDNEFHRTDNVLIFRQLWPNVRAKKVGDYYRHCLTEMRADYECCVHNFIAYPGISDKIAKHISEISKDIIKPSELASEIESNRDFANAIAVLDKVPVEEVSIVPTPRVIAEGYISKLFDPVQPAGEIYITYDPTAITSNVSNTNVEHKKPIRIDGTSIYAVVSCSPTSNNIESCTYTWVDWAIINLARCDKTNNCLPYKLLTLLKNNSELSSYMKPALVNKDKRTEYLLSSVGIYENVITQNIILRSDSVQNKERIDYSMMNSIWIAGLISICPYIISTLNAVKNTIDERAVSYGRTIKRDLKYLVEALITFYDDIANFTPFIPFMADSIQITSNKPRAHLFAELLAFIKNKSLMTMDIGDFIKLEWANVDFYNDLDSITFPAFKNKDKFEWIKEYATDKFASSMFTVQFESTIKTMARISWSALIAGDIYDGTRFKNANKKVDELILDCINIMSECDVNYIQRFIDKIVDYYTNINNGVIQNISRTLTGGNYGVNGLSGGNQGSTITKHEATEEYKAIWNFFVSGIVTHDIERNRINPTLETDRNDYDNSSLVDFDYNGKYSLIEGITSSDVAVNDFHSPAVSIMRTVRNYFVSGGGDNKINIDDLIRKLKVKISTFRNSNIVRDIKSLIDIIRFDKSWEYTKYIASEGIKSYTDDIVINGQPPATANQRKFEWQMKNLDNFVKRFNIIYNNEVKNLVDAYSNIDIDSTISYLRKVVNCDLKDRVYGELMATLHYMYSYYRNFLKDVYTTYRSTIVKAAREADLPNEFATNILKRCRESAIFNGTPSANGGVANTNMVKDLSTVANGIPLIMANGQGHAGATVNKFRNPTVYEQDDLNNNLRPGAYNGAIRLDCFTELTTQKSINQVTSAVCGITNETEAYRIEPFSNVAATQSADVNVGDSMTQDFSSVGLDNIYDSLNRIPVFDRKYANNAAFKRDFDSVAAELLGVADPSITDLKDLFNYGASHKYKLISLYYGTRDEDYNAAGQNNHAHVIYDEMQEVIDRFTSSVGKQAADDICDIYDQLKVINGMDPKLHQLGEILTKVKNEYRSLLVLLQQFVCHVIENVRNIIKTNPNPHAIAEEINKRNFTKTYIEDIYTNIYVKYVNKFMKIFDSLVKLWNIDTFFNPSLPSMKLYFEVMNRALDNNEFTKAYNNFHVKYQQLCNEIMKSKRLLSYNFDDDGEYSPPKFAKNLLDLIRREDSANNDYHLIQLGLVAGAALNNVYPLVSEANIKPVWPTKYANYLGNLAAADTLINNITLTDSAANIFKYMTYILEYLGDHGHGVLTDNQFFDAARAANAIADLTANPAAGGNVITPAGAVAGINTISYADALKMLCLLTYNINHDLDASLIHTAANGVTQNTSLAANIAAQITLIWTNALGKTNPADAAIADGITLINAGNSTSNSVYSIIDAVGLLTINLIHIMAQNLTLFSQQTGVCPVNGDFSDRDGAEYNLTIFNSVDEAYRARTFEMSGKVVGGIGGGNCNVGRLALQLKILNELSAVRTKLFVANRHNEITGVDADITLIKQILALASFTGVTITDGSALAKLTGGSIKSITGGETSIRDRIFREARLTYSNSSAVHDYKKELLTDASFKEILEKYVTAEIVRMFRGFDVFTKYIANPNILGMGNCPLFESIGLFLHPKELTDVHGTHTFSDATWGATGHDKDGARTANGVMLLHLMKSSIIYDYYVRNSASNHGYYVFLHNLFILSRVLRRSRNDINKELFGKQVLKYGGLVMSNPGEFMHTFVTNNGGAANLSWFGADGLNAANDPGLFVISNSNGNSIPKLLKYNSVARHVHDVTPFTDEDFIRYISAIAGNDITAVAQGDWGNFIPEIANLDTLYGVIDQVTPWTFGSANTNGVVNKTDADKTLKNGLMGGNINALRGGVDPDLIIREFALNLAQTPNTRAIYRDTTLTNNDFVPTADLTRGNINLPDSSFYLYKYLYNPRLASTQNNSNMNDNDFVIMALGKRKKFIVDPLDSYNGPYELSSNTINAIVKHPFENAVKNLAGADLSYYRTDVNHGTITNTNDGLYTRAMNNGTNMNEMRLLEKAYANSRYQLSTKLNTPVNPVNLGGFAVTQDRTDLQSPEFHYRVPTTTIIHNIHLNELMLANVPYSKVMEAYMFSPQKDIYNVTFNRSRFTPRTPSVIISCNDVAVADAGGNKYIVIGDLYNMMNQCISDDSFIYGAAPSLFAVHSSGDEQRITYNVLHEFIDHLINDNAQYIFRNVTVTPNVGFDVGVGRENQTALLGGAIKYNTNIVSRFMNTDAEIFGSTTKEVIQSAYNLATSKDEVFEDGKLLYCNLFKSFKFDIDSGNAYKVIFAYVADYFNKHTLSFNAIYNQLCFTSIIYSTAVYKSYIPKFKAIFGDNNMKTIDSKAYKFKYSLYEFIRIYLSNYSSESGNAADHAENSYLQDMNFDYIQRAADTTFTKLAEQLSQKWQIGRAGAAFAGREGSCIDVIANQYTSPSVNSNIFSELVNYITYIPTSSRYRLDGSGSELFTQKNYNDSNGNRFKDCEMLSQLHPSGFMSSLRHFDVTATFIYVMFLWLRQTSHYDLKKNADISYFGNSNLEPFSISGGDE